MITGFLPEAKSKEPPKPLPRCVSEGVFVDSDASPRVPLHLPMAKRLEQVRSDVAASCSKIAKDGKKKYYPLLRYRRGVYELADAPSFSEFPKPNHRLGDVMGI